MKKTQNSQNSDALPPGEEQKIAVNGLQQVLEMLRIADPAFRQSLLRRIATKDPDLALQLARDLGVN